MTSLSEAKPKKVYMKVAPMVPQVVQMRSEGMTLQEIGNKLNLSRQRIHQVIASAKEMEEITALWGFPFSNRTFRILEDLCIHTKDEFQSASRSRERDDSWRHRIAPPYWCFNPRPALASGTTAAYFYS